MGRKEGNVLFNDTLNTFYLRLYGVRHMVKDHSDSERGKNFLSPLINFHMRGYILTLSQPGQNISLFHGSLDKEKKSIGYIYLFND